MSETCNNHSRSGETRSGGKEESMAEIERLKRVLDSIPAKGAINLARRRAILQQIYKLMEELQ